MDGLQSDNKRGRRAGGEGVVSGVDVSWASLPRRSKFHPLLARRRNILKVYAATF